MAKVEKKVFNASGYEKVETQMPFVKFEKEGDFFEGIFKETADRPARGKYAAQVVWIVAERDSGELKQIAEKTVMKGFRMGLKEGDPFAIVFEGEKVGDGGQKYKDFSFYRIV